MRPGFVVDLDRCFGCKTCTAACRLASGGGHWSSVLEVDSRAEGRPVWVPYLCLQVSEGMPCRAGSTPKCVRSCPTNALVYGDLDDPSSPPGRILARGGGEGRGAARPLPHSTPEPRVYYVGRTPADLEGALPDPSDILGNSSLDPSGAHAGHVTRS